MYNTNVVINDLGSIVSKYRKLHLFDIVRCVVFMEAFYALLGYKGWTYHAGKCDGG